MFSSMCLSKQFMDRIQQIGPKLIQLLKNQVCSNVPIPKSIEMRRSLFSIFTQKFHNILKENV